MRLIFDSLLLIAAAGLFLSSLALWLLPDVPSRLQVVTKTAFPAIIVLLVAGILIEPAWWNRLVILGLMLLIMLPVILALITQSALVAESSTQHEPPTC